MTIEELDALPIGTIVMDAAGWPWAHADVGLWLVAGEDQWHQTARLAAIPPHTILHTPAA